MSAPVLEWRGVRCVRDGTVIIPGIDLRIAAGERVALVGANGAGKTTLFDLACGLRRPSGGSVWLRGQRIDRLPPHRIAARGLARSFQAPQVFAHLTVAEHIQAAGLAPLQAEPWLDAFDLAACIDQPAAVLDGTRLRLLDLLLALARDADVLLLDEPTAGLRRHQCEALLGRLLSQLADRTLLLIEHDIDAALRLAHRVVVLHQGRVLADGTPAAVRTLPQVQAVYPLGGPA